MAEALRKKCGVNPELIKSGNGVFEVRLDGVLIFSKKATGRFPQEDEILNKIDSRKS